MNGLSIDSYSILGNKKLDGSIIHFDNISDMKANFLESMEVCYVVTDDSKYCKSYRGNYYRWISGELEYIYDDTGNRKAAIESSLYVYEEPLDHGGYGQLIPAEFYELHNDGEKILPSLSDIAYSYIGVYNEQGFKLNDGTVVHNIRYQAENGPYMDSTHWNGIQCSQFAQAIIRGLKYENSVLAEQNFVDGTLTSYSINREIGLSTNIWNKDGELGNYSACQLARYAAAHGWYKSTTSFEEIEIGDILFFQNLGPNYNYKDVDYKAINHVAVCIGKSDANCSIVQAGGLPSVTYVPNSYIPAEDTDAVNFKIFNHIDEPWNNQVRGLCGFARFPIKYIESSIIQPTTTRDVQVSTQYTAGSARHDDYVIKSAENLNAKYGVYKYVGYNFKKSNNVDAKISAYLATRSIGSSYQDSNITNWNTSGKLTCSGTLPMFFQADSSHIHAILSISTQNSVMDDEAYYDIHIDLYE